MAEHEEDNIHSGHRKRLRELYLRNGIDGLQEHQILELLLFHAIPRRDVNPLAHKLIKKLGSLNGVLNTEMSELRKLGLSQNAAAFLHLVNDIILYTRRSALTPNYIKDVDDAIDFCFSLLGNSKIECMGIICLNSAGKVLHYEIAAYGTPDKVPYIPRRIVGIAVTYGAHAVVLTHNHPSGDPKPSQDDLKLTGALNDLFMQIDMKLYEHVIVSFTSCYAVKHEFEKDMISDGPKSVTTEEPDTAQITEDAKRAKGA